MNRRKYLLLLPALAAILLLCGAAREIWISGRRYYPASDFAIRYGMSCNQTQFQLQLQNRFNRIVITPDKRQFSINGVNYNLCFAPARRGKFYLSALDRDKLFEPILNPAIVPRHRLATIVLDPGHGGKDEGARGVRYREKDITLQVALKTRDLLKKAGYNVLLTRDRDIYLTLPQRTQIARMKGADLFLSIHINAAETKSVSGIETFAMTPAGAASSNSSQPESRWYSGNNSDSNNIALTNQIHRHLLAQSRSSDRGIKWARFQVLRDIHCPAALLELGFISNRAEELKLGSPAYQIKLAQGITNGIVNYHRSIVKNPYRSKRK